MSVIGSISIKDNGTSVLKNLRAEQKKLREDAKQTDSVLKKVWDKPRKLQVSVDDAKKKIKGVTDSMKKLKPVTAMLKAKDNATKTISKVKSGLDSVHKKTVAPVIRVVDRATAKVKSITGALGKAAKAVAVPIVAAGVIGAAAIGGSVSAGMQLEQQQISIEHFVGATNKDLTQSEVKAKSGSYIAELRENANKTPFETGEVIQAGSRAISLAGGDTKEAMSMVSLAEDMAAASGGTKSLMDAMEALGDLKVGETERLKEFGFKVSADEFKNKGFEGVSGDLKDFYGGAAGKLAGSGAGLMSTIGGKLKSNVADMGLGILEQLKPIMQGAINLIDQAQPAFQRFSEIVGQGVGTAISMASSAFAMLQPAITLMLPTISEAGIIVSAVAFGIGEAVSAIAPVVLPIISSIAEKVGGVVSFLAERSGFIHDVISTAGFGIAEVLSTAWNIASPILDLMISAFEALFSVAQTVWPGIKTAIQSAWSVIKPIFNALAAGVDLLAGAFDKVKGFFGGGGSGKGSGGVGKNAKGDNNWRGGLTWVGERGPELIDLPQGTRILPTKESMAFAATRSVADIIEFPNGGKSPGLSGGGNRTYHITINKIADTVQVQSNKDKDDVAERVAKRIVEELDNIA